MDNIKKLQARLNKVEKELDTCRTSVLQDGWQTQRFAKKSRKWDILAQRKMQLIQQIDDEERKL
jgi:allantoicase